MAVSSLWPLLAEIGATFAHWGVVSLSLALYLMRYLLGPSAVWCVLMLLGGWFALAALHIWLQETAYESH